MRSHVIHTCIYVAYIILYIINFDILFHIPPDSNVKVMYNVNNRVIIKLHTFSLFIMYLI